MSLKNRATFYFDTGAIICHRILRMIRYLRYFGYLLPYLKNLVFPRFVASKLGQKRGISLFRIIVDTISHLFLMMVIFFSLEVFIQWYSEFTSLILVNSVTLQHKDQLYEEVCLLLAKGFRSQRLAVRKELRYWTEGVEWFSSRSLTYSVCIYAVLYILYIHTCKRSMKGVFALGGPGGMQWAVSAKIFSGWLK